MRKLFFQQSSSRLFRCFQFFSSYIYIVTSQRMQKIYRLHVHFVVSYSFHFSLHSLFSSFLIFRLCVCMSMYMCVYECITRTGCSIKKAILTFRHSHRQRKSVEREESKRSAWTNFSRIIVLRIKKIPRFESSNAYVENQFR